VRLGCISIVALCGILFAAVPSDAAPAASSRTSIASHSDLGGKCIDVPHGQISPGMRIQMWDCNKIVAWGRPNTEVTVGIVRKSGRSDIRVRLGETLVEGPAAQVFSRDETSQQIKIGNLCVEAWGRGDPQDGVGLEACGDKANQRWRMVASGNYREIIGINGHCLEIRDGVKENGAALDIANCDARKPQQLWTLKTPTRAVLGVKWRKPTEEEANSLALAPGTGAIVVKVLEGGPAEKSGLAEGDAIATIDGLVIHTGAIAPATNKSSPGCSRYMPSVGLTVSVPCDEYLANEAEANRKAVAAEVAQKEAETKRKAEVQRLAQEGEAKRIADAAAEAKRPSSPALTQERWAAIVPNNEGSSSVVWATTKEEAGRLASDACKRVSQTCASVPTPTKEMSDMFAVMCCAQPATSCGAGVAKSKEESLAAISKKMSNAGYKACTLKSYFKARTGEKG
jgi:hypothetical protein